MNKDNILLIFERTCILWEKIRGKYEKNIFSGKFLRREKMKKRFYKIITISLIFLFCSDSAIAAPTICSTQEFDGGFSGLLSPNGDTAYINDYSKGQYFTTIYDVSSGEKTGQYSLILSEDYSRSVNFTKDYDFIVSSMYKGTSIYKRETGELVTSFKENYGKESYSIQPNGTLFSLGNYRNKVDDNTYIAVYDGSTYESKYTIPVKGSDPPIADFSPTDDFIAVSSYNEKTVSFYKASTGEKDSQSLSFQANNGVDELRFSPDGQSLYVRLGDEVYKAMKEKDRWEWNKVSLLFNTRWAAHLENIVPSKDGKYLYVSSGGDIQVNQTSNGKQLVNIKASSNAKLSSDQKWLIYYSSNISNFKVCNMDEMLKQEIPRQQLIAAKHEQLVSTAENYSTALKWQISFEYTKDVNYPDMNLFNLTKNSIREAGQTINGVLRGPEENRLIDRVDLMDWEFKRAIAYIDAITSGKKIAEKMKKFDQLYKKEPISTITEVAYHDLSREIRKQAKLLYGVYGQSTRHAILDKYKKPGEISLKSAQLVITAKMANDKLEKLILNKAPQDEIEQQAGKAAIWIEGLGNTSIKKDLNQQFNKILQQGKWEYLNGKLVRK